MPSYSKKVEVPGKTSQELYDRVSGDIERFLEKAAIGKVEVKKNDHKKEIEFNSSMISGVLNCDEGCLNLNAKISLMAVPFRSKIDEGIERWLKKTFQI